MPFLWWRLLSSGDLSQSTTPQIIITGLPADTLLEARAAETTGIVPALVKRRKKKDEVGQSGVLPFVADNSSFPVSFWDESSRALKVQVKALLSIREDKNQTQLGVESILCAGRIHGHRPTLCRKGRGFNQTLESTDACFLMCLSGVTWKLKRCQCVWHKPGWDKSYADWKRKTFSTSKQQCIMFLIALVIFFKSLIYCLCFFKGVQ